MTDFATMSTMEVWYARLSEQDITTALATATRSQAAHNKKLAKAAKTAAKDVKKGAAKARTRDSLTRCRNSPSSSTGSTGS